MTDVSREALHAVFGADAFALPLFYGTQPALRFELSLGGTMLDQFEQAWDRGREIVDHALGDARELIVVISAFADGPRMPYRDVFRSLRALRVRMGRPRAWWTEPFHDPHVDGPDTLAYVAFACGREAVRPLLWGALAAWLNVEPRLVGNLYVASVERGIVLQPYDDRGMDAAGPNRALLAELYHRFNDRLLDYDRDRMRAFFEPAHDVQVPG
ncbi:DUF3885 domain-containing protein [Longimicrobium sp.]|uniref:DUF3885 domain-containing protein n=1 Tax=Longimicrobium sp. TaxID=2029185 RepID=UPI002E33ACEA|nr:DUF3885 domain-containing protein [Longimicrobium sp.]HEX6042337.1 DUF3885 domain-containing protein [Longimicrobium sp.]